MEKRGGRAGYEFSLDTKRLARKRANGTCEFPGFDCKTPNNKHVGHLTGIADGRRRGVARESITSIDNTIVQCFKHDQFLDQQQSDLIDQMDNKWFTPFDVGIQIWRNRKRK